MEYDPMNLPVLGEKVLKEKRRKVQETLDRVMKLYQREDPELYAEMKTCQVDYEKKRKEKQVGFSSLSVAVYFCSPLFEAFRRRQNHYIYTYVVVN